MKPRVLISLATSCLGGPGKGLLQFLRSGGLDGCWPVVVDFVTATGPDSEYARTMRAAGVEVAGLNQRWRFDPGLLAQAETLVRRENFQLLQSHGYKSHVLCAWLALRTGLPWIAFVHGWTAENLRMRGYRLLEMGVVGLATRVVAVSEGLGRRLPGFVRRKMAIIPNAVDPREAETGTGGDARVRFGIADDALVAGVVGRLSPEKGQLHFVRALDHVRRRIPRVTGLLVGDGQDLSRLRIEAARLGLADNIIFAGHVREMADVYRAMDLVVLPSESEGMPNVALEAMVFGKPVVATRVGGVPEVVVDGETGLVVPSGDPRALGEAMIRVLGDGEAAARLGRAGLRRALTQFDPKTRTERILGLYDEVLLAGGRA